jgi:DNA-binding LytR/AlgR family response regulator
MHTQNLFQGRRILVVEDDYLVVEEMVHELQASGAEVVGPIANLPKAFERLENVSDIQGAVLDINLQGDEVYPLADELARRGIPFVFATAYDETALPTSYRRYKRFMKPVNVHEVAAALLEALPVQDQGLPSVEPPGGL